MALISHEFYTGPALIVGDGNFSFSACLAQSLGENITTQVFATSLDTREQLETNPVAIENLDKLSAFSPFNIIHGVDATNLEATFKDKTFHKIIFNFPHTGGKVKISKCRELLEKFFISASRHIDHTRGVVCVSLCQGQGGTPQDHVQRDHGNTWQVVQQASKAGLILHEVHPFRETDYPGYTSSGFKGRLNQEFTADRGLTYMFIHGSPIQPTPDLLAIKQRIGDIPSSYVSLFANSNHPVARLRRRVENVCALHDINTIGIQFDNAEKATEVGEKMATASGMACSESMSLCDKVHQLIKEQKDFVVSGVEVDFSVPTSAGFHPISHYSVVSKSYGLRTHQNAAQSELNNAIHELVNDFSIELYEGLTKFEKSSDSRSDKRDDLNFSKSQLNLFKPVDLERLHQRKRNFLEWRPQNKDHDHSYCCSLESDVKEDCSDNGLSKESKTDKRGICQLEENYFSKEDNAKLSDIFGESTLNKLYHNEKVLFTYGVIKGKELGHNAWVIIVHLDYVAMVMCSISDIRMLWSKDSMFLKQFDNENEDVMAPFIPFSLFPPIYVHDISFSLTTDTTERRFFQAIHDITGNMVSDVFFRERYVDEVKHQVIPFGYSKKKKESNMIYTIPLTMVSMANSVKKIILKLQKCS